jgi:outer membrane protein
MSRGKLFVAGRSAALPPNQHWWRCLQRVQRGGPLAHLPKAIVLLILLSAPTYAETLRDALAMAYRTSPVLHGQQALQRATAEGEVQARSGLLPQVSLDASAGYIREPYDTVNYAAGTVDSNDTAANLTVSQNLYSFGRIGSAVRAALARSAAGQQGVRVTEQQLFQAAIGAYMDVLRDSEILAIRKADLDTLTRQVANTTSRFNLGADVTRTDVAQAQTQQDAARAALAAAQAQLDASRAEYADVIGAPPGSLAPPASLPALPHNLRDALNRAEAASPTIAQSKLAARASEDDIATARDAELPSIGVQASVGVIGPASPFHTGAYQQVASAEVTVTQPLYSGGLFASQMRAAQDRNEADRQFAESADRTARQSVLTAWSATQAGITATSADVAQQQAARVALKGYQTEYGYGLRSTLDVLIADENLRAAEVALAVSRHDTLIAEASLLAATGDLRIGTLMQLPDAPTPHARR